MFKIIIIIAVGLVSSLFVCFSRNPIISLFSLIMAIIFSCIVIVILLDVVYVSLILVLIFVNGVAVLTFFTVVLIKLERDQTESIEQVGGVVSNIGILVLLLTIGVKIITKLYFSSMTLCVDISKQRYSSWLAMNESWVTDSDFLLFRFLFTSNYYELLLVGFVFLFAMLGILTIVNYRGNLDA